MRARTSAVAHVAALTVLLSVAARPPSAVAQEGPPGIRRGTEVADSLDAPPPAVDPAYLGRDSVVATPGEPYPAGAIRRFLVGDLNRDLWDIPFKVPVLDLDEVGGGLTVDELSGGLQTLGIMFTSRDGRTFQFRSLIKNAGRLLPPLLRSTPVDDALQDQMGALFPLSAAVVTELVESAGLLVARPRVVVMPDDPRLGEYRETFAGRMGWFEERPNEGEGDHPGFGGSSKITGSDELLEELEEEPASFVDQRLLLRARLVDMLVGDWDRHFDQWRWAAFAEGDRVRWEPIPRDRDWALSRIDGVFPRLVGIYSPQYHGFSRARPDPFRLGWNAIEVDRRLLAELGRETFAEVAAEVRRALDDAAIDRAVGVLPLEYRERIGDWLVEALRARRDALEMVAAEFYGLLADWVDVYGTGHADSVRIERRAPGRTIVRLRTDGVPKFEREFLDEETREIRLYLGDGDDHVSIDGGAETSIEIRIVGSGGDDEYTDRTDGAGIHVYDHQGQNRLDLGPKGYFSESPTAGQSKPPVPRLVWETRDWGHAWVPRPALRYDSDVGVYAGFGVSRYGFGFGHEPFRSRYSIEVLWGLRPGQWIGDVEFERPFGDHGLRAGLNVDWWTERPVWFYGFGNETSRPERKTPHRSRRNEVAMWAGARFVPDSTLSITLGPTAGFAGGIVRDGGVFDSVRTYGMEAFDQLGLRVGARWGTPRLASAPRSGAVVQIAGSLYPAWLDVEEVFGVGRLEARTYLGSDLPGMPVLHLRGVAERSWGRTPFGDLPSLGGSGTLPGYTERRFLGQTAVAGAALLRLRLARFDLLTATDVGLLGLVSTGRVWLEGEASDAWHSSFGGGIWFYAPSLDRAVSLTYARGSGRESALYLKLGFIF